MLEAASDLLALSGAPRTIRAGSRTFDLHPLRLVEIGRLQAWLDDQAPDPRAVVRSSPALAALGRGARRFALRWADEHQARLRPLFGSPMADVLTFSVDGVTEILRLSVGRGRPPGRRFGIRAASRLYWSLGGEAAHAAAVWSIWGDFPRRPTGRRPAASPDAGEADVGGDDEFGTVGWNWWQMVRDYAGVGGETLSGLAWPPETTARLTIPQLRCLGHASPVEAFDPAGNVEADIEHAYQVRQDEIRRWAEPEPEQR